MKGAGLRLRLAVRYGIGNTRHILVSAPLMAEILHCYPLDGLSLAGKTIVDVGCDFGNSPLYWWLNKAFKVIAYEKDRHKVELMKPLLGEPWLEFRGEWKGEMPDADGFKIDIEGGEKILNIPRLQKYQFWFVALHEPPFGDTMGMAPELRALGGEIVHRQAGETVFRGRAERDYIT